MEKIELGASTTEFLTLSKKMIVSLRLDHKIRK